MTAQKRHEPSNESRVFAFKGCTLFEIFVSFYRGCLRAMWVSHKLKSVSVCLIWPHNGHFD